MAWSLLGTQTSCLSIYHHLFSHHSDRTLHAYCLSLYGPFIHRAWAIFKFIFISRYPRRTSWLCMRLHFSKVVVTLVAVISPFGYSGRSISEGDCPVIERVSHERCALQRSKDDFQWPLGEWPQSGKFVTQAGREIVQQQDWTSLMSLNSKGRMFNPECKVEKGDRWDLLLLCWESFVSFLDAAGGAGFQGAVWPPYSSLGL